MAIAFDTATNASGAGSATLTWAHTVTGSNPVLVVGFVIGRGAFSTTSVTYNGVSMTQVQTGSSTPDWVYILKNPASGANNIVVSTGGDATTYIIGCAASYSGCYQTTQPDSSAVSGTTGAGSGALNVTTTDTVLRSGCWMVGFSGIRYNQNTSSNPASNKTDRSVLVLDNYGVSGGGKAAGALIYDTNAIVSTGANTANVNTTSNALDMDNFLLALIPETFIPNGFLSLL